MSALEEVKSYALTDEDIRTMLGSDISILNYPQLESMKDIDDMFDSKGRCILLYPNAAINAGHWCCLIRRPDSIEFFDPYGDKPEEQKNGLSRTRLQELEIHEPYLMRLMRNKRIPIFYNKLGFQQKNDDVATCGRHCVVRLLYSPYDLDTYHQIIKKSGLSPDSFVTGITFDKLKK